MVLGWYPTLPHSIIIGLLPILIPIPTHIHSSSTTATATTYTLTKTYAVTITITINVTATIANTIAISSVLPITTASTTTYHCNPSY